MKSLSYSRGVLYANGGCGHCRWRRGIEAWSRLASRLASSLASSSSRPAPGLCCGGETLLFCAPPCQQAGGWNLSVRSGRNKFPSRTVRGHSAPRPGLHRATAAHHLPFRANAATPHVRWLHGHTMVARAYLCAFPTSSCRQRHATLETLTPTYNTTQTGCHGGVIKSDRRSSPWSRRLVPARACLLGTAILAPWERVAVATARIARLERWARCRGAFDHGLRKRRLILELGARWGAVGTSEAAMVRLSCQQARAERRSFRGAGPTEEAGCHRQTCMMGHTV